jgi:hypothetical protein
VDDRVITFAGDARLESNQVRKFVLPTLLFLESLRTEEFVRWFIDRWVNRVPLDTLFYLHDLTPPTTRVRFDVEPPWNGGLKEKVSDWGRRILDRPTPESVGFVKSNVFPPTTPDGLSTTDGVSRSEGAFMNRLVQVMPSEACTYLHNLADEYQQLSPHRYDSFACKSEDKTGRPMEWKRLSGCKASLSCIYE